MLLMKNINLEELSKVIGGDNGFGWPNGWDAVPEKKPLGWPNGWDAALEKKPLGWPNGWD